MQQIFYPLLQLNLVHIEVKIINPDNMQYLLD